MAALTMQCSPSHYLKLNCPRFVNCGLVRERTEVAHLCKAQMPMISARKRGDLKVVSLARSWRASDTLGANAVRTKQRLVEPTSRVIYAN
jgi:hypothetical protein